MINEILARNGHKKPFKSRLPSDIYKEGSGLGDHPRITPRLAPVKTNVRFGCSVLGAHPADKGNSGSSAFLFMETDKYEKA